MHLSRTKLKALNPAVAELPADEFFLLPEKVIQFGTGVLLRGLPDYFIDKANKQGIFNGRIVVVKSTASGGADAFELQDGLYTQCIRGIEHEAKKESIVVNASISRVIAATNDWNAVLECATNPDLQLVISNTTEVGITLVKDNIHADPPDSFPGKLLSFLYKRYKHFNGDPSRGLIIVPTELITDNGKKLEAIVLELAHQNGLEGPFLDWLENANIFCNSLVDRIVPGKLPVSQQKEMEALLGYEDDLMIMSEVYSLWAIEAADPRVKEVLSFYKADDAVAIVEDIDVFRELKLRLLNGSHTFCCGLAHLSGFVTVKDAMEHKGFLSFITDLMMEEIAPSIASEKLTLVQARDFAVKVLDRYRNPFIEHKWLSISLQYTSKMAMRNVPLILQYYERYQSVPANMALGFAAYLLFMKCNKAEDGKYYGEHNGISYLISDDSASFYEENWNNLSFDKLVPAVLCQTNIWGTDLSSIPGFTVAVTEKLEQLMHVGAAKILNDPATAKVDSK
ncbi:MAG: tagaturonate reductase [Terrimonas sp.]|nr:tagaturonate reductase [Terrimonas sp.]